MPTIAMIVIFPILLYFLFLYEHRERQKTIRKILEKKYGKKPHKKDYDFNKIGMYWKEFESLVKEDEKIDNVTWNDLEMNQIFNRIDNCSSFVGEQILYSTLHCLPKDETYGLNLEKKIEYFANNSKERESIQLELCHLGKEELSYYLPILINNLDTLEIKGVLGYKIMQALLALSLFMTIVFQNQKCIIVTFILFMINMVIYALKKVQNEINLISINNIIQVVKVGNIIIDSNQFSYEGQFYDLQEKVDPFRKLVHVVARIQKKKEVTISGDIFAVVYDYLIGATLWDFTICDKIHRMIKEKRDEYMKLYRKIGEIDMAIAIASFRESLPKFCIPAFCKEHSLQMEEVYHPLIDEPVCNSIDMNKNCIITGSNASGKSTYIKAVAINVILAQSINTCMAKKMVLPYVRIITSMAVRDDLMEGESYYIKEIKYLNRIVKSLSSERFVICAIDEILRGTNTEERIVASAAILNYLNGKNCIAVVASHDIELTQILKDTYENYHFQEEIQEKDIIFDYKIHEGVATSKNAIKLLEYVGFPNEIIKNAQKGYFY